MPPNQTLASLKYVSDDATTATFTATYEGKHNTNPYNLFVRVDGYDGSAVEASRGFAACRWNELASVPVGTECQVTVDKNLNPDNPPVDFSACVVDVTTAGASAPTPGAVSNTVTFP